MPVKKQKAFQGRVIIIKQVKKLVASIAVAYVPSLFIIAGMLGGDGAFFDTPFVFDLLTVLLYTFPMIVGIMEALLCLTRAVESKKHISAYNIITLIISLSAIAIAIALSELIYASIALAVLLLILESIRCAKEKCTINLAGYFKQISFWMIVSGILLLVALCSGAYRLALSGGARPDPLALVRMF